MRERPAYEMLRDGRFLLVDTTAVGAAAHRVDGLSNQVRFARCAPALGLPAVLLVRPDGYVAWASDDSADVAAKAESAVAPWCGRTASDMHRSSA